MCGIIGVSGITDAARLTYLGLYALQHRGQESAGIVVVDREGNARAHRGMGLVSENFHDTELDRLPGDVAVGHTRYSTTGSTVLANAQPCSVNTRCGPLAIAHNGNLTNAAELKRELVEKGAIFTTSSDTEVLVHLIARSDADTVEGQIRDALEQVEGAYSLVIVAGRTLYAVVDSRGFRPLVIGRLGSGMVVASETCALDLVGASIACELEPGDFVRIEDGRVTELPRLSPRPVSRCVFELVYFARPDSTVFGESVDRVRRELGRQLAREQPAKRRRGLQRAGQLQRHGARLLRGVRDQAGARPHPQPLRRPHLHQPDPDPPGGEGQDQVQPGARRHPRQVVRRGGRQPGPREHQPQPGADDPRRRRPRGAPAAGLAADHRPLPLRHRHPDPRGADRLRATRSRRSASSWAWTRWATSRSTGC